MQACFRLSKLPVLVNISSDFIVHSYLYICIFIHAPGIDIKKSACCRRRYQNILNSRKLKKNQKKISRLLENKNEMESKSEASRSAAADFDGSRFWRSHSCCANQ
jgi:hypothetical protein